MASYSDRFFNICLTDGTRLIFKEFGGQNLLHIIRFTHQGHETEEGIWIQEREILELCDIKTDFDRALANGSDWKYRFNDFITIQWYTESEKLDLRYVHRTMDEQVFYSKNGVTLSKNAAKDMFTILQDHFTYSIKLLK